MITDNTIGLHSNKTATHLASCEKHWWEGQLVASQVVALAILVCLPVAHDLCVPTSNREQDQ